jgi:hypothetical protein
MAPAEPPWTKKEWQKDPVLSLRLGGQTAPPFRFFYYTTYSLSTGFEHPFLAAQK